MPRRPTSRGSGPRRLHGAGGSDRPGPAAPDPSDEPELLLDVREALRSPRPLPLLALASSLIAATDPDQVPALERLQGGGYDGPTIGDLVGTFLEVRQPEISALLTVLAELVDDEILAKRIRRELEERPHKPPRWLRRLTPIRIERARQMSHVLGDGDNVMLGVVTAADHHLTFVVYIDHNLGTLVKDAFVIEDALDAVTEQFRELSDDEPGTEFLDLDLADAHARIREAIDLGAITYPPLESDSWPACRPLLEWVLRHLPEGGRGYERPEWSEDDLEDLSERFLTSDVGRVHDDDDAYDLLHGILWFASDYGPGDPLRWSPTAVELLLTDFLARKVIMPAEVMRRAPALLRDLVRFAHSERGIPTSLTDETLQAIDQHRDEFLRQLDDDAPTGIASLMQTIGQVGADLGPGLFEALLDDDGEPFDYSGLMLELLRDQVGGEDALNGLDTEPLPDEPLDLSAVEDDIRDRVREVADLSDRCCDELFDVEHRTACRRLLVDVAAGDPQIFRRRSKVETAAAALVWTIAKANDTLEPYHGGLTASRLIGWFGLTGSVSQRAATFLRAVGVEHVSASDIRLGSTRYLVAGARASIIETRDRYRE